MKNKNKVSVKEAKKNLMWAIIDIDKLPEDSPVIGINNYISKSFAKFHLVKEVIVPVFKEQIKDTCSHSVEEKAENMIGCPYESTLEEKAYSFYWAKSKVSVAPVSRPDMIIGYIGGHHSALDSIEQWAKGNSFCMTDQSGVYYENALDTEELLTYIQSLKTK